MVQGFSHGLSREFKVHSFYLNVDHNDIKAYLKSVKLRSFNLEQLPYVVEHGFNWLSKKHSC